jgi:hypothetical protein
MDRFIPTAVSSEKFGIFLHDSREKPKHHRNNISDNY